MQCPSLLGAIADPGIAPGMTAYTDQLGKAKTEQPRGARRNHQNAKTNGSRGKATREEQIPGQPEGDSAKIEKRSMIKEIMWCPSPVGWAITAGGIAPPVPL